MKNTHLFVKDAQEWYLAHFRRNKTMTKKQMEKYKKILLKIKEQHTAKMNDFENTTRQETPRESSGEVSGYPTHMADMASDTYDRDFALNRVSMDQDILYAINEALNSIENGTYGTCESCSSKISQERLLAVPFTSLCIKCQGKKEKRQKV
ncbi:hypothetical protein B9J78_00215 [bacterium Unc6]|nr:hypothetical protein [bacterium Unc6]